jgi:diguanylate cyclase (GGDEF)-like protein/PAS domain S-box-containing protein
MAVRTTAAQAALDALLLNSPTGCALVDPDLVVTHLNASLAAVNGLKLRTQVGRPLADVVPQLWPRCELMLRGVLDSGEAGTEVEVEAVTVADVAQPRRWLVRGFPVIVDGQVTGVGIVVADVTEAKWAEDERRRLASIVAGSGDAIFGTTVDGTVTSWNPAAERLFGYAAGEIVGQPVSLIAPTDRVAEQSDMRARLSAGSPHERIETVRRHKNGTVVEVLVTASTATDAAGNVIGHSVIAHDIAERRATQLALEASERRLAEAQHLAHLGSFEFDLVTRRLEWSAEYYKIVGVDPAVEATGERFYAIVHRDDQPAMREAWLAGISRGDAIDAGFRIVRPDGEVRSVRLHAVPESGDDGVVRKVAGTLADDTEQLAAERDRRAAATVFEVGFEQAGIGAVILDLNGMPQRVNSATCRLLGRPAQLLVGRSWSDYNHPDEQSPGPAIEARIAAGHDTYADERRYVQPDGTVVWASSYVKLVLNEDGQPAYYFVQLQDITERKQMEQDLAHQALHDSLTGLANRALLGDRIDHGLAVARRRGSHLGVIFVDLDHFKDINDSFGHSTGDGLLTQTATRIDETIRDGDTVARFGGDEFVVVCDDVSMVEVEQIAERVLAAVCAPYVVGDQELNVTASLGVALADESATRTSLLRDSDAAMYRAKERGRGRVEVFDELLRSKVARQLASTSELHRALERGEFVVMYQPIVSLATGAMVSAEALVRWQHPERGLVSPDEFISLAEETGLIVQIGAWVLEQACEDLAHWHRRGSTMSVSVNVSVRQLVAPEVVPMIQGVLDRTGIQPDHVCLELTESVFMEDVDYFGTTLARIKDVGVGLSIDDFGTGYSSLSYLKRFPVDAVKVDRSFVAGLGTDLHDTALVAAIIAMADALDLEVTAEGVETAPQLAKLSQLGCQRAQGFYLDRPMLASALTALVEDAHCWEVG